MYKAKVLYIGPKELCEVKAPNVTEEGELVDTPFDVSRSSLLLDEEPSSNTHLNTSMEEEQMRFNKDCVNRLIKVEESVGLLKDLVVQMNTCTISSTQRLERVEMVCKEILRRNPGKPTQGSIDYSYASARAVAEIRELKPNRNALALALEKLVYEDESEELSIAVDSRVRTRDRVLFIQQCVFKYFEVPEHLLEDVWKNVKDALNSRVRRSRKAAKANRIPRNPEVDEENILSDDLFT
ncbi:unnamed protein product [Heligmosomoides polygyrus]|uniref:BEN domain-containing protein n=1 Tax=Heligmosomoides polygyrus TaxID=6339 RepID=A0A183FVB0_HELPZ|nr:unnamed protein product [Heligmosomoides polygyrus]